MKRLTLSVFLAIGGCAHSERIDDRPRMLQAVVVDRDDTVIDEAFVSASGVREFKVRFAETPIADAGAPGVLRITASNITVDCEGKLFGASEGVLPDRFAGTGVVIEGAANVTVRGLRCGGYKVGLRATQADGLTLTNLGFDNLWRMRLKSTKQKEHNDDWLWPHENDKAEWVTNYGAAVCIERSFGVRASRISVRNGQNGVILDRVEQGMVYDNDCSFLSGWGIAMWRSSRNMISRNALDFCVRGYSHGVYNRGQDSAGLLMFEQCSGNTVVENSMTHSGDGVFVFAGKEALGEKKVEGMDHTRRGCNDNVFARNDLSFAPAHGLEVTFSFGNRIEGNTFEENAICGVWGGYSQGTLITGNTFWGNGRPGAGEGGGINIEHGYRNTMADNVFVGNSAAVKLWDDDDAGLLRTPWAVANHKGSRENRFVHNRVDQKGGSVVWVRKTLDTEVTGISAASMDREPVTTVDCDDESTFVPASEPPHGVPAASAVVAVGDTRPVGARDGWWGREWIVMGEWGPVMPAGEEKKTPRRQTEKRKVPVVTITPPK